MSLIPLLLGRAAARLTAEPAGPARYHPGGGHRPIAGLVAVGLPAALVIAVALSPFELPPLPEPRTYPPILSLPKPPPPPQPKVEPQQPTAPVITVPRAPLPPVVDNPVEVKPGPPLPPVINPPVGTDPPVVIKTTPPPPPLIEAKLDSRYKSTFQPEYPPWEQRGGIEGTARVRVLVGIDGRVKDVVELSSASPGFFAETRRRALAKWRFKPATRGGTPEESWVTMTVRFELNS